MIKRIPLSEVKIIAINRKTNEEQVITDLYWFEEECVQSADGEGYNDYDLYIEVNTSTEPPTT
jgi:hypothetical protein